MPYESSDHRAHPDLLAGFIRLHVLHHAAEGDLTGTWMIEELRRHGYRISSGTLYPMLHGLERRGYLESTRHREGKRSWRAYRLTSAGQAALAEAKTRLRELFRELIEEDPEPTP
jgi:DNA-binding PadR family transcriptional regulator